MSRQALYTGYECFHAHHSKDQSPVARLMIKGACDCKRVAYSCRPHSPLAIDSFADSCTHLRSGAVIVKPLRLKITPQEGK